MQTSVVTSFEAASQFKYLGTTVTNQYSIQEEIKHSVQNLLSINVKVGIYRIVIITLTEEHIGTKRDEVTEGWRKLHNEELRDLLSE
jgi:hypothetical protein